MLQPIYPSLGWRSVTAEPVDYNWDLRPLQIVTNGRHLLSFEVQPKDHGPSKTIILDFVKNQWTVEDCMEDPVELKGVPTNNPRIICTLEKSDIDLTLQCGEEEAERLLLYSSDISSSSSSSIGCVRFWAGLQSTTLTFKGFESSDFYRTSPGSYDYCCPDRTL